MSGASGVVLHAPGQADAGEAARGHGSRAQRAAELLREIHDLRAALHEALEQYERRVDGQLAEVVRALHRPGTGGGLPAGKTLGVMLGAIAQAELKPQRGRARDLVRIQELVAQLTELATPKG
jgi:hypothetical protein